MIDMDAIIDPILDRYKVSPSAYVGQLMVTCTDGHCHSDHKTNFLDGAAERIALYDTLRAANMGKVTIDTAMREFEDGLAVAQGKPARGVTVTS